MSRMIWTRFLVRKRFHFLGFKTQSFHQGLQEIFSTSTKSHNGRKRYQPVQTIVESADHCSRKLRWRGKLVSSARTNNAQTQGWTNKTGSQGGSPSGPSKQKKLFDSAVVQCEHPREFLCLNPIICKEEGGREIFYGKYKLEEFVYLHEVMKSVKSLLIDLFVIAYKM